MKKIFLASFICLGMQAESDTTQKVILSTSRTEAIYELFFNEAQQLTAERKEQLMTCADKAIEQRKRETGLLHMWRDYTSLAYTTLFALPTGKMLSKFARILTNAFERQSVGLGDPSPIDIATAFVCLYASLYIGIPFSIKHGSKLFMRTQAKERLADAQFIKKTIERLPVA